MGIATDTDRIAGVKPQMDDTNKLAVSLYGKGAAAGDTPIVVVSSARPYLMVSDLTETRDQDGTLGGGATHTLGGVVRIRAVSLYAFNGATWDRLRNVHEQTALASGSDTTGGRTSADLVNYNAKGITILLDVTVVNGTGRISEVRVQAKLANGYADIGAWTTLGIAAVGQYVFQFAPGAASAGSFTAAPIQAALPRNFRVQTVAATDAAGNDVTYSVTVVYQN